MLAHERSEVSQHLCIYDVHIEPASPVRCDKSYIFQYTVLRIRVDVIALRYITATTHRCLTAMEASSISIITPNGNSAADQFIH